MFENRKIKTTNIYSQFKLQQNIPINEITKYKKSTIFIYTRKDQANLNDIFQVADNIAALYLGNMAAQVKKSDVTHAQVVQLITTGKAAGVTE